MTQARAPGPPGVAAAPAGPGLTPCIPSADPDQYSWGENYAGSSGLMSSAPELGPTPRARSGTVSTGPGPPGVLRKAPARGSPGLGALTPDLGEKQAPPACLLPRPTCSVLSEPGLVGARLSPGCGSLRSRSGSEPRSQRVPPRCLRPHLPDGFEVGPGARRPLCSGGSSPSHSPTWGAARHDGWGLPNLLSRHQHQPHSGRRHHGPGLAETVARAVADLRPQTAGHSCDPRSSRQSRPDGCPRVLTSWTQTPPRGSGRVPGVRPSQAVQDWPAWGTPRSARPAPPALPVRAVLTGLLPRAGQPWPQPWSAVAGARRRVSPPSSPCLLGGNLDAPPQTKIYRLHGKEPSGRCCTAARGCPLARRGWRAALVTRLPS